MKATEQSFRRPEAQRLADQGPSSQPVQSRRLPSAPRERKPALAALAVLLIVGGALLTAYLVIIMGDRVPVLKTARDVPAGQRFVAEDFVEVSVPSDMEVAYIPADQLDIAIQKYAKVGLTTGTLLTEAMTADAQEGLVAGKAVVGLALKAGQYPAMLNPGQRVQVIFVSGEEGSAEAGRVLADRALVQSAETSVDGGGARVDIVIDKAVAADISAAASAGRVALAYLPGGKPGDAATPVTPTPQASTPVTPSPKESPTGKASPSAKATPTTTEDE
ncbi:SAF domain-containing protein [Nonomuraea sp. NPDC050310]|uniref:SAF domain-containing protein n=1 Tax=unclassified Nonomuraea TaxID=2593643 RepID=UPI0033FF019F